MRPLVRVVGIGAGDPGHLTLAAVKALNATDVVFLADKGESAAALRDARIRLCEDVIDPSHRWRVVASELPGVRDRGAGAYAGSIAAWREARTAAYGAMLRELRPGERGAFLAWGDPTLFDGTIAILDDVRGAGEVAFDLEVVPGVSAAAALAARHGVTLNRQGQSVLVTSGRRLATGGWPDGVENVVVLLDTHDALGAVDDDVEICWGAFLGLPGERLLRGRVGDLREEIDRARTDLREEHGWLFDTYLLRRTR